MKKLLTCIALTVMMVGCAEKKSESFWLGADISGSAGAEKRSELYLVGSVKRVEKDLEIGIGHTYKVLVLLDCLVGHFFELFLALFYVAVYLLLAFSLQVGCVTRK